MIPNIIRDVLLKNNFVVQFGAACDLQAHYVTKVELPKYSKNKQWSSMKINFSDIVDFDVLNKLLYIIDKQTNNEQTIFPLEIKLLDSHGETKEKWYIQDGEIIELDFCDLDYKCNDIKEISLVVQPKVIAVYYTENVAP